MEKQQGQKKFPSFKCFEKRYSPLVAIMENAQFLQVGENTLANKMCNVIFIIQPVKYHIPYDSQITIEELEEDV